MKKLILLIVFAIALTNVYGATTYTWTGTSGGTWGTTTNWNPNGTPVTGDSVVINTASAMSIALGGAQVVKGITFMGGGTITFTTAANFTATHIKVDGSPVVFSADQVTINSSLTFNGGSSKITHTPATAGKAFILGNGNSFILSGNTATNCLDGNGQYNFNTTNALTAFFNPSNVYYQLILQRGIITLGTDLQVARFSTGTTSTGSPTNNLGLVLNGKTLTLSATGAGSCTLTNTSTVNQGIDASATGSKVVISTSQATFLNNITGRIFRDATTIDNLEINSSGTFISGYPLTVKNLILTAGAINNSTNNITINNNGTITRTAGTLTAAANFGTATSDRVNLTYAGSVSPGMEVTSASGTGSIGTLTVNDSKTLTLVAGNSLSVDYVVVGNGASGVLSYPNSVSQTTLTVNKNITVNTGASFLCGTQTSAVNHLLNVGGNITNSGTFTPFYATGKAVDVILNSTSANQNLCAGTFNNLTIANTSGLNPAITLTGDITVNNTLTVGNGSSGSVNFAGVQKITTAQMTINNWQANFVSGVQINSNLTFTGANSRLTSSPSSGGTNLWLGNGNDFTLNGNSATNYIDGNSNLQFNFNIANLLGTSSAFYFNPATTYYNLLIQNGIIPLGTDLKINRIAWGSSVSNTMKLALNGKILTISGSGTSVTTNTSSTIGIDASVTGSKVLITSTAASVLNASGRIFYPGTAIDNLEFNSSGNTLIPSYPMTVKNLILTAGTINNSTNNITIATGGSVTTTSGSTTGSIVAGLAAEPTIGTATAGAAQASVAFTAPTGNGGSAVLDYTVTSNPGNLTATGSASPITVTGLTNGTAYTFIVTARNSVGNSAASSASNSVTPVSQTVNVSSDVNISTISPNSATDVTILTGHELTVTADAEVKSITVAPGAKLTLTSGALTLTNGITLQNTASATASFVDSRVADNPTAIAGTVEQAITETNRNWYVAVPVTGKLASDITLSGAKIVQRNEALSRWDDVLSGAGLTAGVGYIAVASASSGTTSWSLNGNLNSGKVEVGVTRSGASSIGFNLLGNPYPSYLNWEQVLNLNATNASLLQSSIWYRTKSGASYAFQTYNSAGRVATPTSTTGYIPPMQAFWVRANAAGTVTFTNAMRSHGDGASNKLKVPKVNTQQIIRLQVSNAVVTDEAVVYIDQNAQNAFDRYDTEKMFNNVASQPELYTKAGTEKLVINGLNEISDNQEMPLGLTYTQGGDLKLKLTELSNFDSNSKVYLRDKQLSTETELSPETEYAFNTAAINNNESRFSLVYKVAGVSTGTSTPSNNRVSVFVNAANQITIIAPVKSNYAIYNTVGQLIENGVTTSNYQTTNYKLKTGVFVVKVNNQSTRVVVK